MPAYAHTTVPVERTQAQVKELLRKHGAAAVGYEEQTDQDTGASTVALMFTTANRVRVRMVVALRVDTAAIDRAVRRAKSRTRDEIAREAFEQEARRVWRVLAHSVKARLVAVDEGLEVVEQAFLAHVVLCDSDRTVYEHLLDHGALPALPPGTP